MLRRLHAGFAGGASDRLLAIQVDAPNVDIAVRLAVSHHIDSRPTPPPAGISVRCRRDHAAALRPESASPRPRWLTATTREPACQDCSNDLMIDPMTTGTVKRPPANLRRPRGREAHATHPPAPLDDPTSGNLEQQADAPAILLRPEAADPRKTATWAWSKAETERRRQAAATQPTLAPVDAFPDEYSTADDLAAVRLDADPDATGPHSQIIRGVPRTDSSTDRGDPRPSQREHFHDAPPWCLGTVTSSQRSVGRPRCSLESGGSGPSA